MIICKLEKYLQLAGISVSYFCNMMQISRTCYYQWIKNEKMPTIEKCYHAKDIISTELDRNIPIEDIWEYKEETFLLYPNKR